MHKLKQNHWSLVCVYLHTWQKQRKLSSSYWIEVICMIFKVLDVLLYEVKCSSAHGSALNRKCSNSWENMFLSPLGSGNPTVKSYIFTQRSFSYIPTCVERDIHSIIHEAPGSFYCVHFSFFCQCVCLWVLRKKKPGHVLWGDRLITNALYERKLSPLSDLLLSLPSSSLFPLYIHLSSPRPLQLAPLHFICVFSQNPSGFHFELVLPSWQGCS